MASEQVEKVIKAEQNASQAELQARQKAESLLEGAKLEAKNIINQHIMTAEKKAVDILDNAKKQSQKILENSGRETDAECKALRASIDNKFEEAVSMVISDIIE